MIARLLSLALAVLPAGDTGYFAALRDVDRRMATIAWRLQTANAALCIRGESECSTGQPRMPTSRVEPESAIIVRGVSLGMCNDPPKRVACLTRDPPSVVSNSQQPPKPYSSDFAQNSASLAVKK